jgi:DNA processing protein
MQITNSNNANSAIFSNVLSPYEEMIAFEALWAKKGMTDKKMSELFTGNKTPSEVLKQQYGLLESRERKEVEEFLSKKLGTFGVCVNGSFNYPDKLQEAEHPVELFYYKGDLTLLDEPSLSVVGAREASPDGLKRAAQMARKLVENNFVVVSGLAKGVDTSALKSAIEAGGKVIGVIGTPISEYYPAENRELQDEVAKNHLLVSQVPFYRYHKEPFNNRRFYFPKRNITMSAVSLGSIIIEASDTSGTLTQARAAVMQKRKLFILNSCFEKKDITWPLKYEKKGAIRVKEFSDVISSLQED